MPTEVVLLKGNGHSGPHSRQETYLENVTFVRMIHACGVRGVWIVTGESL